MNLNWRLNIDVTALQSGSRRQDVERDDPAGDPDGGHHPDVGAREPPGGGVRHVCPPPPPAAQPATLGPRRHRPLRLPRGDAG